MTSSRRPRTLVVCVAAAATAAAMGLAACSAGKSGGSINSSSGAFGTVPNAPLDELTDPPELPVEQAARPMAAATTHTARIPGRREMDVCGRSMAVTFLMTNLIGRRRCHRSWLLSGLWRAYGVPCGDLGRILSQVAIDVKTGPGKARPHLGSPALSQ